MPNFHELIDSLGLLLMGLAFVLVVLGLLYGVCSIVGVFFKPKGENHNEHHAIPAHLFAHHQHPTTEESEVIDIPFVLAATIDRMMAGVKYRIIRVREISPTQTDWAREGRHNIFSSHRIR